jgi:hypothetical protein
MGVFGTGAPVGAGVGLLAGGLLLGLFTLSPAVLPFLGELLGLGQFPRSAGVLR